MARDKATMMHPDDGRRVVAAWNFCRGIPTETLEQAEMLADEIMDDMNSHGFIRQLMAEAKDRRGFARVAANIAEDRYGAGSNAARCTIVIMLRHGLEMAKAFVEDLEHHEGS
jgi:hypothetical protein